MKMRAPHFIVFVVGMIPICSYAQLETKPLKKLFDRSGSNYQSQASRKSPGTGDSAYNPQFGPIYYSPATEEPLDDNLLQPFETRKSRRYQNVASYDGYAGYGKEVVSGKGVTSGKGVVSDATVVPYSPGKRGRVKQKEPDYGEYYWSKSPYPPVYYQPTETVAGPGPDGVLEPFEPARSPTLLDRRIDEREERVLERKAENAMGQLDHTLRGFLNRNRVENRP